MPSKERKPTKAQIELLTLLRDEGGAQRRRYASHRPGGMTFTWRWASSRNERPIQEASLRRCMANGWVAEEDGALPPEHAGKDPLTIAIYGLRLPDVATLTPAGLALVSP